jgi:excisionase family DNA binding protein
VTAPGPPRTWRGLALPLPGGQVLLSRQAAALLLASLQTHRRTEAVRNGTSGRLSADMAAVFAALGVAARPPSAPPEPMSVDGHADIGAGPDREVWPPDDELISVKEAAEMLWFTDRHVRRLADAAELGPVEKPGGTRLLHRSYVEAYRATRAATQARETE